MPALLSVFLSFGCPGKQMYLAGRLSHENGTIVWISGLCPIVDTLLFMILNPLSQQAGPCKSLLRFPEIVLACLPKRCCLFPQMMAAEGWMQ
jgi:hypothetical protein